MPHSAVRDHKKLILLLNEHEAVLNASFVRCIRIMLNMLHAMHQELVHYHILREDKRHHIHKILNDILGAVKDFQNEVNTETERYQIARARLPNIEAPVGVSSQVAVNELAKSIELWRKVLPYVAMDPACSRALTNMR